MNAARRIATVPAVILTVWVILILTVAPGEADPFTTFAAVAAVALAVLIGVLSVLIEIRDRRVDAADRDFSRVLDESGILTGEEATR